EVLEQLILAGIDVARHPVGGRGHENGSVESAHGHLKRRICQALILRGSNDFSTIEEYQAFITQQVMRHNRNNQDLVKEERLHLKPLPQGLGIV
ncbi:hypothetical protein AAIH54_34400, partial [Pseudomonas aeruginosa]